MSNITYLSSHSPNGEKRGNVSWVQCNSCGNWFHATTDLINLSTIKLHCPSCHFEFQPKEASKIIIA